MSPREHLPLKWRQTLSILSVIFSLASHADERPNFVVILCDDLGYSDLACYGHPTIKTPHLDRLAAGGIRLTSCYSAAPVCSPSRAGLLTGRSPNRAGIYDWIPEGRTIRPDAREQVHLRANELTLPSLLQEGGYATCLTGKYHCNSQFNQASQAQPGDLGFDHWFATQNNAAPSHANPRNFVRNGETVGPMEGYSCQLVVSEGIRWLEERERQNDAQPFFLMVAFHEPHEPIASPPNMVEGYQPESVNEEQAEYFANVSNLDRAVGRLITTLEKLNETQRTLVFFTSDNGPETLRRYRGAGRSYGQATPLRGMKLWTTEAGFRVPGILYWPGTIEPNQTITQPVSSIDLFPTFLSLARQPRPANRILDGVDLAAIFEKEEISRIKPLFWCFYNALNQQQLAMRTGRWKVIARLNSGQLGPIQNAHDGNIQALQEAIITDLELYDMNNDIGEATNLAPSRPALAAAFQQQLEHQYRELTATSHYWQRAESEEKPN